MKHKSNVLRSTSCLKIFQEKGEIAIQKELQQIHDVEGFEKLLWVNKRGRPDVAVAISFLCTRVQKPDMDDWKKLAAV